MKIEVSIGEAIDKYSILELKSQKISDAGKLMEIQKELEALNECQSYKVEYPFFYQLLMYVNDQIWTMTDTIKSLQWNENPLFFSELSNQIFEFNQKRFRIKNWFNLITDSTLKEQKSYIKNEFYIWIEDEDTFYSKIAEIHYLVLEYDSLVIYTDESFIPSIQKIIKIPTIVYGTPNVLDPLLQEKEIINLRHYSVKNVNLNIFELPVITYLAGGMFGDFIQSLSVINEKFYETGRKGILYIINGEVNSFSGDRFRNGVESTYNDTYEIIKNQPYIKDYQLYNNQEFEINLNRWRDNPNLFQKSWYDNYKETYQIEWGTHRWLNNITNDDKWKDTILINTTNYRWPIFLDFKKLETEEYKKDSTKLLFITSSEEEYHIFLERTNLQCELYKFVDFNDLCIAIHSCKLFVGSLSGPLAVANALYKDRICGLSNLIDDRLNLLNDIWPNFTFEL